MNCKYTNLTKVEIEQLILPFIPKNKRGFSSKFNMVDVFKCMIYKLKTGCQWNNLFVDIESVNKLEQQKKELTRFRSLYHIVKNMRLHMYC